MRTRKPLSWFFVSAPRLWRKRTVTSTLHYSNPRVYKKLLLNSYNYSIHHLFMEQIIFYRCLHNGLRSIHLSGDICFEFLPSSYGLETACRHLTLNIYSRSRMEKFWAISPLLILWRIQVSSHRDFFFFETCELEESQKFSVVYKNLFGILSFKVNKSYRNTIISVWFFHFICQYFPT